MKKILLFVLLLTAGLSPIKVYAEQSGTASAVKQACKLTVAIAAGYLIREYISNNYESLINIFLKDLRNESSISDVFHVSHTARTLGNWIGSKKAQEAELLRNTIIWGSTLVGGMFAGILSKAIF